MSNFCVNRLTSGTGITSIGVLLEREDQWIADQDASQEQKVLPQRPGFRHHRKENYVCRDALSWQSTECSKVQEVSQSQLQQPRGKLNCSTVETPSHHDLHRELLVSTKRGLLPGEKPELKRVLEQRRLEQHREQELALQPPLELETELRKRQQILLEYEQEEIRRREEQEREVPEFVRVKDNLRRTQMSGQ
uniref:Toll like receptor 5 n=1 Tax=Salmo trutta TaxID=8032 RepID=A0A673ZWC1_SALTR